jgi:hypothetical protein
MGRTKNLLRQVFCWLSIWMMTPIFVTEETDTHNARAYLWSLIPKGSLVITQHIFYTISEISDLKSCLPDLDNKPIYLDLSYSPELLESSHAIGVLNRLKEIAPLKIIVNEYKKFYNPQEDFIYFPLTFYSYSHGAYLEPTSTFKFPRFVKKTKRFMSLNNRPVWHRIWLFTELASNNLLDKFEYSFVWDPKINYPGMEHQLDLLPDHKRIQTEAFLDLLPIRFDHEKHLDFNADQRINLYCYNECAVNIVTESCPNLGFLSEKICKPLACYQIPILISHTGATQFCVDAGFDMFEDIIPWRTWDSIEDEQERCDVACKFIVDYIKHGDPIADWERCQHRAINNRQRLVSDDFKKFCTSQFKL